MTSIINDNPMKLLDGFIFSRLTDGQRIRQVYICTVTRGDNFFTIKSLSGVATSVDTEEV